MVYLDGTTIDGVFAIDTLAVGAAKIPKFTFLYANNISAPYGQGSGALQGIDGIAG